MSKSAVIIHFEYNDRLWEHNMRIFLKKLGHTQEEIDDIIGEREKLDE